MWKLMEYVEVCERNENIHIDYREDCVAKKSVADRNTFQTHRLHNTFSSGPFQHEM